MGFDVHFRGCVMKHNSWYCISKKTWTMKWLPTCCLPYVALQSPFIFNNNLRQLLLGPELSSVPVDLCVVFAPCTAQIPRKMTPHGFWDPDFETRCTKTLHVLHGSMTSTSIYMQVGVYIFIIYIYTYNIIYIHVSTPPCFFMLWLPSFDSIHIHPQICSSSAAPWVDSWVVLVAPRQSGCCPK